MRQRPLKMDLYGITFDEYKELYHFCQQYNDKKQRLADMLTVRSSCPKVEIAPDGSSCVMPHGKGQTSDPVMDMVIRRERLFQDVKMIEQAAIKADGELYQYILRSVTTKDSMAVIDPPCGKDQFLAARRRFFFALWQARST